VTKEKLERRAEGPRRKGIWMVCQRSTLSMHHSSQQPGEFYKLQAPGSGHTGTGKEVISRTNMAKPVI